MTIIRTGKGDQGDTQLGAKTFRKGHPLVLLSSALDVAQAHTIALPLNWGEFKPRELLQELLFSSGSVLMARNQREFEAVLQEIGVLMESQIGFIDSSLEDLTAFIRVFEANSELMKLRTLLREAECRCVAAHDYLELEAKGLNENLLYMLMCVAKALNIASDWVFA